MTSRIDHHRPQYPDVEGLFKKSYHLEMVSDAARTETISLALSKALRADSVFCELGCGTGLFTIQAAARCRKAYAVELDPDMVKIASDNINSSRWRDKIELIPGDALRVDLPEKVDVVFAEMMSIWGVEEPQVLVANRARRDFLKPGGVMLPERIVNLVELGWYNFRVREIITMEATTPLFTGILPPAVLTERRACHIMDFSAVVSPNLGARVELDAIAAGRINCAVLSSYVQMGPDVVFSGSDTLMPRTVVPLVEEVVVRFGDRLRFQASARARSDWKETLFAADVIGKGPQKGVGEVP
jgi:predicted RNA methylase